MAELPQNLTRENLVSWMQRQFSLSKDDADAILTDAPSWSRFDRSTIDEYLASRVTLWQRERADKKRTGDQQYADAKRVAGLLKAMDLYDGGMSRDDLLGGSKTAGDFWQAISQYRKQRNIPGAASEIDAPLLRDVNQALNFIAGQGKPPAGGGGGGDTDSFGFPDGGSAPRRAPAPAGSPNSGGGGATSGGDTSLPATAGSGGGAAADLGGTPNPDGKFGIPGGAQIWVGPDGFWYAVYTVPGTNPPVPMAWKIESNEEVAAIFGPGQDWHTDRTLTAEEWQQAGVLSFGPSRLLANASEHPFDAFVSNFETEAAVRPWLRDPEVLALTTRAILENRTVTDAELAGTEWWRTHTEGERQWMATFNADPKTAQQRVQDSRDAVRKLMITAGIGEPPDRLVQLVGDRLTAGTWTQAYVQNQIAKLGDPAAPGTLDETLGLWVNDLVKEGVTLNTLTDNTAKVDQLVRTGLGPAFAQAGWTDEMKQTWAGRLRNDPNAQEELERKLSQQRVQLFPEYTDPSVTYDEIASTWRGVVQQTWGEVADETDPLFLRIMRTNDLATAQQLLREEGRKRGVKKVVDDTLSVVADAFGGSLRRSA